MSEKTELKAEKGSLTLVFTMVMGGFLLLAGLHFSVKKTSTELAIIFPPTYSLEEISKRMTALPVFFVRSGITENIIVVKPFKSVKTREFRDLGAWLVTDAIGSGGCNFFKKKTI